MMLVSGVEFWAFVLRIETGISFRLRFFGGSVPFSPGFNYVTISVFYIAVVSHMARGGKCDVTRRHLSRHHMSTFSPEMERKKPR